MRTSIDNVKNIEAPVCAGLAALAALCSTALTSPVGAADRSNEPRTAVVSYADLNLNAQAGAETMYRRLRAAARRVCAPLEYPPLNVKWHACFDQAIGRAVAQVDQPVLTAYHVSRNGKAPARLAMAKRNEKQ